MCLLIDGGCSGLLFDDFQPLPKTSTTHGRPLAVAVDSHPTPWFPGPALSWSWTTRNDLQNARPHLAVEPDVYVGSPTGHLGYILSVSEIHRGLQDSEARGCPGWCPGN